MKARAYERSAADKKADRRMKEGSAKDRAGDKRAMAKKPKRKK